MVLKTESIRHQTMVISKRQEKKKKMSLIMGAAYKLERISMSYTGKEKPRSV